MTSRREARLDFIVRVAEVEDVEAIVDLYAAGRRRGVVHRGRAAD